MTPEYDLSILIPARNEQFLARTVQDILQNMRGNTEIIVVLDGQWSDPPIDQHDHVSVIHLSKSIGQRAATNLAAGIAQGTYLMKVDAHCAFGEGFDEILLVDIEPDITMVPIMKNLHVFDWVCADCEWRNYQGPTPDKCPMCGGDCVDRDILWIAKPSPNSTSYRFNKQLEFKYFGEYKKRQNGDLVETMSLQGSCWMAHRDKYFGLNLCDESLGSWGGQGAEVAIKTWLSGGRAICNKRTWYAHLFRTQGKDFSFPYPNPGSEQKKAKNKLREIFLNDKWEHAVRPLSWIVDKFAPIPDWHDDKEEVVEKVMNEDVVLSNEPLDSSEITKAILYYTDSQLDDKYALPVQRQLMKSQLSIISVSLEPMTFGHNIHLNLERGYMTMFKQILAGLKETDADIVFFAEHDVIYHLSHFDFIPPERNIFYYNENVWKVHAEFGFGLHYLCNQTSGLCAYRDLLIDHYERRIKYIQDNDPGNRKEYMKMIRRIGFEPGTHGRVPELKGKSVAWESEFPNIDIRHNENLTPSRWRKDQFRNQRFCKGWTMSDTVPGWGKTLGEFDRFLEMV